MKKADLYMKHLREEGYMPSLDSDGDVMFKRQGLTYCVFADEDDEEYFRIVLPNFWSIDSEQERRNVYEAASHATSGVKVGKVYPVGDNVWASVELLLNPIESFAKVFDRALLILDACVERFRDKMMSLTE